jgi:hypothetical protein
MRDRPSGGELAALAREILEDPSRTATSEEQALAARCFDIAERERRLWARGFASCAATLTALYGEGDPATLFARLAADIRRGIYDAPGPARETVRRLLWEVTLQKLRESNPELLAVNGLA